MSPIDRTQLTHMQHIRLCLFCWFLHKTCHMAERKQRDRERSTLAYCTSQEGTSVCGQKFLAKAQLVGNCTKMKIQINKMSCSICYSCMYACDYYNVKIFNTSELYSVHPCVKICTCEILCSTVQRQNVLKQKSLNLVLNSWQKFRRHQTASSVTWQ